MNNNIFQHSKLYRITLFGRLNPNPRGNFSITLNGKGESVWYVGLAWEPSQYLLQQGKLTPVSKRIRTRFFLIASNYFQLTRYVYVEHNEMSLKKKDRVKIIEPFTLKQFPLLIGTRTTTLFEHLLRGKKITKYGKNLIKS